MSTPTILDYPGARYLYNVQAGQDAEEYATKDAFTGSDADTDGAGASFPLPKLARTLCCSARTALGRPLPTSASLSPSSAS